MSATKQAKARAQACEFCARCIEACTEDGVVDYAPNDPEFNKLVELEVAAIRGRLESESTK